MRLDSCWVEELVKPFNHRPPIADGNPSTPLRSALNAAGGGQPSAVVDVVSGFFVPDPHGVFETALAATTLPVLADIDPEKFLPSSRSVAFRKRAWEQVNGYPEWLDFCEDLIFDFALRDAGFRFVFAPRAVAHFRPRANLRAFFKQYYQYRAATARRICGGCATSFATPPTSSRSPLLWRSWFLGFGIWDLEFCFWDFSACSSRRTNACCQCCAACQSANQLRAIAWVPIIRVTGDVAKMIGYPVGVVWQMKNRKGSE